MDGSEGLACQGCERLREDVQQLRAENSRLREENAELKRRLTLYENPNAPSSLRRYPVRARSVYCGKRFPGRPSGHPGKTRPFPKPDVVIAPERKDGCEQCGAQLGEPSYVNHRVVEEISNPSPGHVIDFLEFEWRCEACGTYTVSRHPDCPPDGRFGKNLLVQTTLMKFEERLPLQKIAEGLERQYGLSMTPATVLDMTRRVADWLRPEYEAIRKRIQRSKVVYTDETGEKVDGEKYWLWCFTTDTDTLTVIRKSRGKKVLKEILGEDFKGIIVCDGWRSYSNYTSRIQRCWAHLLREAKCLAEQIDEAKPLSEALHRLYSRFKDPPRDRSSPDEVKRLVKAGKRIMMYWATKPYETGEVRRFVAKIRNGIDHWFTFLTTPGVEPTNNRAERALREHVVQRKIIGTFRNGKGTRIHETIMTMLTTWKQRGLNPTNTLAETLTKQWMKS
jgi:transposase